MKNNKKKGFTLIELLVVIAILAILATVSVVGYTNFIRKAHVSNDTVIAKELTTLVQTADITDPVETFDGVIKVLRDNGFLISNLKAKTKDCYFVWDIDTNQMLLVNGANNYEVLFPEDYAMTPSSDWYVASCNKESYNKVLADLGGVGVNVKPTVATTADLADMLNTLTEGTIYVDESLALSNKTNFTFDNAGAVITLDIGDNTVSSPVLNEVPFLLNAGTLNVIGGDISTLGTWVDSDGRTQESAFVAYEGATLNVKDTKIESSTTQPLYFRGADGTANNVTLTAKRAGISVRTAEVTLTNCNATVTEDRAIWVTASQGTGFTGDAVVTIDGGTYKAAKSTIGMYGGTTAKATLKILNGTFTADDGIIFDFYDVKGAEIIIQGGTFGEYTFEELKAMNEADAIAALRAMTKNQGNKELTIVKTDDGFKLSK